MESIGLTRAGRELYSEHHSKIFVEEGRIRESFTDTAEKKKKFAELVESIKQRGQISPALCRLSEDGSIFLVAGERRLRACRELDCEYEFILTTTSDPLLLKKIELEENLVRDDLTWQEKNKALTEYHMLQQQINENPGSSRGGQSVAKTAKERDMSVGAVQEELEIARFMELEEVRLAPNKTEAKKIIARIKEDFARAKALKEARALAGATEGQVEESEDAGEVTSTLDENGLVVEGPAAPKRDLLELVNYYLPHVLEGRMEEHLAELPDEFFQIVLFDPPWGVGLDEDVDEADGRKELFEDRHELFATQLEEWLKILYSKMALNSHLYVFFGIKDHGFVYSTLEKVGFTTNWMPLIWYKQGAHRVRTPKIWPGRSYEPIAFARKGSKDLQWQGAPDVVITPAPTGAMKGSHKSAKHPDIYLNLLKRSGFPGDKVLDPMAGSGMAGVACDVYKNQLQLDWTLIEEKPEFVRLSIANLVKGYTQIVLQKDPPEPTMEQL